MAGRQQHDWPDDDEIVRLVEAHGSRSAVARHLGVPIPSFSGHVNGRPGLPDRCAEAAMRFKSANRSPITHPEPGAEVSELELLRARNAELEQHARRSREDDVDQERIIRRLEAALPAASPRYRPAPAKQFRKADGHEFVLLFSDTHAGEVVTEEETLGMNRYDWNVMLRRMARMQQAVLSFQSHRPYPISKLHVWFLGDMLSGSIHEELANTNELADAEATMQFAVDAAKWLEEFVPHFPSPIEVCGVPGNHPRRAKKPSAKRAHNNDDWLAYKAMELYHRQNPAFRFNFPLGSFALTTVAERWRCLLMHGDGIRSTMPGVPWGGVVRRITTLEQQFAKAKQPIDYVALGHFHTANSLDGVGVKTFLNGSVKGLDEYSLKQFGSGRAPSQLLLTFHPSKGITDVSMLDLEDQAPASEPALAA